MKISLAGPSYTSASVNAAAQQTMNLVPELIETPNEPVRMVLYGRPGIKLFTTVSQPKIRAMWAGGGRLFVVGGPTLTEVHQDGTTVDRTGTLAQLPGTTPDPAQIFSNGHQLMIVSGHQVYCDNGTGPVACRFQQGGTGHTVASNNSLNWDSGDKFTTAMVGLGITVNGRVYSINAVPITVPPGITALLTPTPPDEINVPYYLASGALVDGVTGGFIDGYFVVNRVPRPDLLQTSDPGRQFNLSGLLDGTIWDTLMFGIKEGRSDYIQSVLCDHEELILFGTESTEVWTNIGAAEFPFQRVPGAFIQEGSVAIYAPCSVGVTFCFLGGGPNGQTRAYQMVGLQPVRISTHAVEWAWNAPGFRVNDAVSYSYIDAGHLYWVINFWQQQKTWVYDVNTQLWHERALWNPAGSNFLRYLPWYHAFIPEWGAPAGGKHIVGNPASGQLYEMSLNFFDDNGTAIEYARAFPHLINENQWAYHSRLEVLLEMGALSPTDPLPVIGLDWSDDHGHTWKDNISRTMNGAPAANYTKRAVFRRLGKSRDRVYRVGVTAHTKVALIDTFLEATQGFA